MDLSHYYEQIKKQPLLSREEEEALFDIIKDESGVYSDKDKEKAKERIITANLRFVFQKAKARSKGDLTQFEELIAAGNEGLLKAFNKFEPSREIRYLSYAGWWVMQTQLKEMSQMRVVALPIWKQQLAARIAKEQNKQDHLLTKDELKEKFPDQKIEVLVELSNTKYLTYYFEDLLEDGASFEEIHVAYEHLDKDDLLRLCKEIPHPHGAVVEMSFGLTDGKERSATYIADVLTMTRDDVRRVKREALEMLQALLI